MCCSFPFAHPLRPGLLSAFNNGLVEGVAMVKRELVGEASFEGGAAQLTLPVQPVQSNVEFLAIEIATAPASAVN